MITRDYSEAVRQINTAGHGSVKLTDGRIISGTVLDIQSKINDPDGIGYFTLGEIGSETAFDVYANEFAELLEIG